jgi:hypothetical protein
VWRDQKPLWVLYNHCSPGEAASLDRWSDSGHRVSVGCPRAIRDYFYGARSVDVLSQLHYAYLPGRKAMRSWPRLAWWLLDMCVINSSKLWSKVHQHPGQLRFREELMHELLKQLPPGNLPRKHGGRSCAADESVIEHYPDHSAADRDCVVCSLQAGKRKRSRIICSACGVHLCIGECFRAYHAYA